MEKEKVECDDERWRGFSPTGRFSPVDDPME